MMVASDQGEAVPALTAMAIDPATGAPNTNAANASIEQNIASPSTESAEATTQADQAPTTTPVADSANSAASPVTAETNTTANDSKANNPEKVA
jgi:hypothetical protein